MDHVSANGLLEEFVDGADEYLKTPPLSSARRSALKGLTKNLPLINAILADLTPDARSISADNASAVRAAIPPIKRAQALLGASHQMEDSPHPDAGSAMPLIGLHMPVLAAARKQWDARHYRHAVIDAAEAVSKLAQRRLQRHDISGAKLMGESFSDKDPELNKARFRCPGNRATETIRAQQEGAKLFAMGCFLALRDPAVHGSGDWNPVTAFEHLAALSIVSRWITSWNVDRYVVYDDGVKAEGFVVTQQSPSLLT